MLAEHLPSKSSTTLLTNEKLPNLSHEKSAHHLIIISSHINNPGALLHHFNQLSDHFHMRCRKVRSAKLPTINDVTVQNKCFGTDAFEIFKNLRRFASIGAVYLILFAYILPNIAKFQRTGTKDLLFLDSPF